MSSFKDVVTPSVSAIHLLGRVKWFNNKAGYGFITVTNGAQSGSDIFVHHSAINIEQQQYKYLVQGEYVEFDMIKTESEKHEWQASHVSGIKGGKLMCETRRDLKIARNKYKSTKADDHIEAHIEAKIEAKMPRQKAPVFDGKEIPRKTSAPRVKDITRSRMNTPRPRNVPVVRAT
jgi:CspA family cold shock protein